MSSAEEDPNFLHVGEDGVSFRVQESVYDQAAVAAALHRFTDRCFVHLERSDDGWFRCRVVPRRSNEDGRTLAGLLANEMLDQLLRQHLQRETEPVRRLILAQAFSRTNILHPELDEADPVADPLRIVQPDPRFARD